MTNLENEIALIVREMDIVKSIFQATVKLIPSFDITDAKVLPYGLRAHTRSIAWIVEQVITQQTKFYAAQLGLNDVEFEMPDTCLHDCIIYKGGEKFYVNVKIHNIAGKRNKNDISAVEKLYMQYTLNPSYRLIFVCFGIKFDNLTISFDTDSVHVFTPQFLSIYVNPRNDKIQSFYHHEQIVRSRKDFLRLLKENSRSIVLE